MLNYFLSSLLADQYNIVAPRVNGQIARESQCFKEGYLFAWYGDHARMPDLTENRNFEIGDAYRDDWIYKEFFIGQYLCYIVAQLFCRQPFRVYRSDHGKKNIAFFIYQITN